MTRLHPQDLRALVAASMASRNSEIGPALAIKWADALLVELERSAKPETDKDAALQSYKEWDAQITAAAKAAGWTVLDGPIQGWILTLKRTAEPCDHAAIRADAYRCGFADARAGKVNTPIELKPPCSLCGLTGCPGPEFPHYIWQPGGIRINNRSTDPDPKP